VEYQNIRYAVADRIATIELNRPGRRNALSVALRDELVGALREAERDDEVSVVLIEGAGGNFSSGYDLGPRDPGQSDTYGVSGQSSEHFDPWTDPFARRCLRDWMVIWDLLKPVVAKVRGYCLAGGTELMSMCDIVFVADDAVLGYPPMRGMASPDVPYFAWKMSMARAKYLQLTGNSVTGREAAEMGWVAKSFPAETLDEEVARELRPIAQIAPDLLAANKGSLNQAYEIMGMRTALQNAWQWHALSIHFRPRAREFFQIAQEQGLKQAIEWRDGPFRQEGFHP
jgi:enoyl-CoA hydratase